MGAATDPPWARGAPASAQDFVVRLYRIYQSKPNKGIDYTNSVTIRRYMTPELGALLLKKMKADDKRAGLPDLEGDPYIDTRDWTTTELTVAGASATTGTVISKIKASRRRSPSISS